MNKPGIIGDWVGEYTYDRSISGYRNAPLVVAFSLSLTARSFGRFSGYVTDDPQHGMSGTGVISGWRIGGRVWFKKLMNEFQVVRNDGRIVPLNDIMRVGRDFGVFPHPPIRYCGRLSLNHRSMEGTWRIDAYDAAIPGQKPIRFSAGWGTWRATRR